MINQNIVEELNYYVDDAPFLGLALMINGEWGSGKTYFIKKNLENRKHIYLSIFGCSSSSQVRRELFYQLSPILRNKVVRGFLGAAKSVVKAKTGYDFDSDKKEDISFSVDVGELNFWEYFENQNKIIVVDDLERYTGSVGDLFGFISKLCGEGKCKVIIVCNDSKMDLDNKKSFDAYLEKIIWNKLDFKAPIDDFLENVRGNFSYDSDDEYYGIVFDSISDVINYEIVNNFRIINSCIMICGKVKNEILIGLMDKKRLNEFLKILCFLFICFKQEKITNDNLKLYEEYVFSGRGNDVSFIEDFLDKYNINKNVFSKFIKESNYFDDEINKENIVKIINSINYRDEHNSLSNCEKLRLSIIERNDKSVNEIVPELISEIRLANNVNIEYIFSSFDIAVSLRRFGLGDYFDKIKEASLFWVNEKMNDDELAILDKDFHMPAKNYDEDIRFNLINDQDSEMEEFLTEFHRRIYRFRELSRKESVDKFLLELERQDVECIKILTFSIALNSGYKFYLSLNESAANSIIFMIKNWETKYIEKFIGGVIKRYLSEFSKNDEDENRFLETLVLGLENYVQNCKGIRSFIVQNGVNNLKQKLILRLNKNNNHAD